MPAGSIFCNSLIVSNGADFGKCYFACIPGFSNADRYSYNGCEAMVPQAAGFPFPPGAPAIPYQPATGTVPTYPFAYGGYFIGDYHAELYLSFLTSLIPTADGLFHLPNNLIFMQYQFSLLYGAPQPVVWY
jgi:hypothetical protein